MPVRLNNVDDMRDYEPAAISSEAVELMKAIAAREIRGGESVTQPAQVFYILTNDLGFERDDDQDMDARVREFITEVRTRLVESNRRSPSYNEVLEMMRELGYTRNAVVN